MTGLRVVPAAPSVRSLSARSSSAAAVNDVIDHAAAAIAGLHAQVDRLERWAGELHRCLGAGGMVLAAGNGGSATHADHLVGELVGRFRQERRPLRASSLTSDQCAVTAIANDYGYEEVFARQITGLARPGDVVLLFSTSGRSPNVLAAARAAHDCGARVLALTGAAPNPLAAVADDAVAVAAADTASVQDAHHVSVHALCAALDELVLSQPDPAPAKEQLP